jgi:hypothetical protein
MGKIGSTDEFLGHRGKDWGDSSFLDSWKEKGITVWLHTAQPPQPVWRHNFPHIVVREDRETKEKKRRVQLWRMNCREPEDVLRQTDNRDEDTDELEKPFEFCPMCRLTEEIRRLVKARKLGMTSVIFKVEGVDWKDNPTTSVIHAGAACGLLNQGWIDALKDEQKTALAKMKITSKSAGMERLTAKLNYLFLVVDDANPSKGVRIAVETQMLGDKVKTMIHSARKSLGSEAGDPLRNPYAMLWEYNERPRNPNETYSAIRMEKAVLTPVIRKLIHGPIPDTKSATAAFDVDTARAELERFWVGPKGLVDWDKVFALKEPVAEPEEDADMAFPPDARSEAPEVGFGLDGDAPAEAGDEVVVACDGCKEPIKLSDPKCPHCGHVYDEEAVKAEEPPPAPKMKSRAEVAAERAAAAKKAEAPKEQAKPAAKKTEPAPAKAQEPGADLGGTDDFDF